MAVPEMTSKAHTVLDHANGSTKGFFDAFDVIRRGKAAGRTAHVEQDQLRAALVFAAAGLDSVFKELIRGAVPMLAIFDVDVRRELETFVRRQLRGEADEPGASLGTKFLARVLIADSPMTGVIEDYILELTGSSLQSASQVVKTLKALGLNHREVVPDLDELDNIFRIRNQIIHELDVNLRAQQGHRDRNDRAIDEMVSYAMTLLEIARSALSLVDAKFEAPGG